MKAKFLLIALLSVVSLDCFAQKFDENGYPYPSKFMREYDKWSTSREEYHGMINKSIIEYAKWCEEFSESWPGAEVPAIEDTYIEWDFLPFMFEFSDEVKALGFKTITSFSSTGKELLKEKPRNVLLIDEGIGGDEIRIRVNIIPVWLDGELVVMPMGNWYDCYWKYSRDTNSWEYLIGEPGGI